MKIQIINCPTFATTHNIFQVVKYTYWGNNEKNAFSALSHW